ncbi:hypothetical protein HFD88_004893 [Aspergillus terreus]|nr:hypothetical protein HFD88_004893 [Aspergillus terreus]
MLTSRPGPADEDLQPPVRVKKRKHLPVSEDPSSKNQIFYFVDSNSSSREKRAHVMRHHVQEKRKQRKHSLPRSDPDKKAIRPFRYLPWEQKKVVLDESGKEVIRPVGQSDPVDSDDPSSTRLPVLRSASCPAEDHTLESPITLLDASRKDPFETLPIDHSTQDVELADYWIYRLTYWSGQNKHIKNSIFKAAMNHPLTFQAVVLAYCARWKTQLYNLKDSHEAETHVDEATQSIDRVMKGSMSIDVDTLALALTGMALHEERFGSKQIAQGHADRAVQILRPRAGSSSSVGVFLHYVRYNLAPPQSQIGENGQQWLMAFLRSAEDLMLEHNTDAYLSAVPQRRLAFQMDSPLFPLLSSGPRPSQVPHDCRMYVVRNAPTQELSRTAALIYITKTLWDFQDSPGKTGRFLNYLRAMVKEHQLDRNPACETLIWLLLEERCDTDLKDAERGWSTGELLKMHKQLRPDLQFLFNEILFSLLMLTPPLRGIDAFENELYGAKVEGSEGG